MIWWLVTLGIFAGIVALMYVPDWIKWAKWNRRRKRATPGEARDMRPPVGVPFWSSYGGHPGVGGGDAADCYDGGGFAAGGFDGGGGGDGGGDGGCG